METFFKWVPHSGQWKRIFCLVETVLFIQFYCFIILKFGVSNHSKSFWLVEVNFFHFSDTPASERYSLSSGNVLLNQFAIPYGGDRFFGLVETVFCLIFFFYKWKPSLKLVETSSFWKDFVPVERDFPPSGNCFLLFRASFLQVETVTETSWNK